MMRRTKKSRSVVILHYCVECTWLMLQKGRNELKPFSYNLVTTVLHNNFELETGFWQRIIVK